MNPHNLKPDKPKIITSETEVTSFYNRMDPREVIDELIEGNYVLIENYYYNGLQVLEELKKVLKRKYNKKNFQGQREFRFAFRNASHRLLLMVVDHKLDVKKAPKIGWLKILYPENSDFLISFPEVQGLNSSWQWYINGLEIEILNLKIHPYYGSYFPTRFDHLELFNKWLINYKGSKTKAIDVGVGSGVLSYQLLQNGFSHVLGTDINKNSIIGATQESEKLGFSDRLSLEYGDLFANCDFKAELIVFNPPWLIAKHKLEGGIDKAIYYEGDLFPRFFKQAKQHLEKKGKLVILFSNLGKVVGEDDAHPILNELHKKKRFKKVQYMQQSVKASSKKTRRKNWRKEEKVELWVLTHF
ncbi:MAG: methyltransferase [Candidatus Heimdallarchaeota archaeon]|nr:methyltransferase [Candidatus Heimdallarchaeota archaeon]MCK5049248.1 methyltransferase [Candidatus Heimdallarchaeota archaeon]